MADLGEELRFTVPLYSQAEAAQLLAMPASTLRTWTQGYVRRPLGRPAVSGEPLITFMRPERIGFPSVPFVGLAEGIFLSALRRADVPMQRIRPAIEVVRSKLGVEHALASRRLYHDGAELLWEISADRQVNSDTRDDARSLIVLRNDQYVFREVVERYLRSIMYDDADGYARRVRLPEYEVAELVADPFINFGRPVFARRGAPLDAVLSRLRAGESTVDVAADFGVGVDEVCEAATRARLRVQAA